MYICYFLCPWFIWFSSSVQIAKVWGYLSSLCLSKQTEESYPSSELLRFVNNLPFQNELRVLKLQPGFIWNYVGLFKCVIELRKICTNLFQSYIILMVKDWLERALYLCKEFLALVLGQPLMTSMTLSVELTRWHFVITICELLTKLAAAVSTVALWLPDVHCVTRAMPLKSWPVIWIHIFYCLSSWLNLIAVQMFNV